MQYTYGRLCNSLLFALGSAAFAACGGGSDNSTTSASSVDAAYSALVGEVAQCAKQVDACLTAAGSDATALDQCRTQFASCRDSAGAKTESGVASAVTTCTSQHRDCAKGAPSSDAGASECRSELRSCLSSATPRADAGAEGTGGKVKDCIEDLKSCVEDDGKPGDCAHALRSCVVDALPSIDLVAPRHGDDSDEADDRDAGVSGEDHGDGKRPPVGTKPADPAKPPAADSGKMDAARKCVSGFSSCVESGAAPQTCLAALKDCKSAVEP